MSRVAALHSLQETDLKLDAHRARLAEIERLLDDSPAVQAARQHLVEAEAQFNAARIEARGLEHEVQELAAKISDAEGRLYSGRISNPKELGDLQADVESLKRRRAALEERQLEAMINAETAEARQAAAQTALQQSEAEAARIQSALNAERGLLRADIDKLEPEREALLISVPAADRELYDRLRANKNGRAVARLEDDVCLACGVQPTSQIAQAARRATELARCPSCERILYVG